MPFSLPSVTMISGSFSWSTYILLQEVRYDLQNGRSKPDLRENGKGFLNGGIVQRLSALYYKDNLRFMSFKAFSCSIIR